jgi:hypothetical protein
MPKYKINITPEVSQIVEANNIDDARKIVKAEIAKGVISPVYDELLFDYDTGVDDLRIRRLLGRAERLDEKEAILQNFVGSSGFIKTTDGQLALTPKGLRQRGHPVQTRTLADGSTIELNTIIDSTSPFERGDLADLMGVVGPIVGSVAGVLPQGRIFKTIKALSGNSQVAGMVLGSAVGGGAGKLTEEAVDAIQGFQLQDTTELAKLFGTEAGLSALGEGVSQLGAGLWRVYFGAKAPSSDLRVSLQGAKGRDTVDIQRLDVSLGRNATEKEIQEAIANGKVKTIDEKYRQSLAGMDVQLGGRTQQIAEAVIGVTRSKSNIPHLTKTFDNMTTALRKRGASLNAYVDDVTKEGISDSINKTKNKLASDTNEAVKATQEAVKDLADSYIGVEKYLDAPGIRQYGDFVLEKLGEAKGKVNKEVGDAYNGVDKIFSDIANYDSLGQPINATAKAIDNVIKHYQRKGLNVISQFKARHGLDKPGMTLQDPISDINVRNVLEAEADFKKLNDPLPRFEAFGEAGKPFGKLTRVLETKRRINKFIAISREATKERDLFYEITRLLDDADLHKLKGENFLEQNPQNADSIFTVLGLKGGEIIKLEQERGLDILKESLSFEDIGKINQGVKALRDADKLNRDLNEPFDNAIIKQITNAARGSGAFDPDQIFDKLIFKGSTRQLEDFYKALQDYDNILIQKNQSAFADNFNRAKSQTLQRLFKNAFDRSTDPVTDTIDYTAFAKYIQKFEGEHPGKIDVLFRNVDGQSSGDTVKSTINQLVKISPKLKPKDMEDLANTFVGQDVGLSTTPKGEAFALSLRQQAQASAEELDFLANRNLADLPSRTPDEIVETIFRPKNSQNIARLKEIMEPEDFAKVQEASLGKLLEDAIDFNLQDNAPITDIFKVGALKTSLEKYSTPTLEAMFGKEFTQDITYFANSIDILTKGEIGRGNFPGALISAGIAAGIVFAPLAALPTLLGLGIVRTVLGTPGAVKFLAKTDKGSIKRLLEITNNAARQFGVRMAANAIIDVQETTEELIDENISDLGLQDIIEQTEETSSPVVSPQVNIRLPQVSPVQFTDPLGQSQEDRIEFAERLFRRPVI